MGFDPQASESFLEVPLYMCWDFISYGIIRLSSRQVGKVDELILIRLGKDR